VTTPGVRTRGARRIVCGGARRTPEVCYYTDDHYASFRRIRE
jgi:ribonuclease T1